MSHKTLRFNVILDEKNKGKDGNDHTSFDPIYTERRYNTHYGLYANFVGTKDGKKFKVSGVELELQNYTGIISIGISKFLGFRDGELDGSDMVPNFSTGRHIRMYVLLQALNSNFKPEIFTKNPETGQQLDYALEEGDMIEVIALFEPVSDTYSNLYSDPNTMGENSLIADEEFTFRNGETIEFRHNGEEKRDLIQNIHENGLTALDGFSSQGIAGIFGGIGGSDWCRMAISDVYVR